MPATSISGQRYGNHKVSRQISRDNISLLRPSAPSNQTIQETADRRQISPFVRMLNHAFSKTPDMGLFLAVSAAADGAFRYPGLAGHGHLPAGRSADAGGSRDIAFGHSADAEPLHDHPWPRPNRLRPGLRSDRQAPGAARRRPPVRKRFHRACRHVTCHCLRRAPRHPGHGCVRRTGRDLRHGSGCVRGAI